MNISRWLATGFLGLAVSLPSFAGKSDDTLNVAFSGEIATLDNYRETGREGLIVARLIYDSLLSRDVASGEFLPELASSYTYVDDKTLDLEIRKNVRFHNGQALTADDVVYTLNLVSSKQYAARYQIAVTWIDKVEKLGDFKVRIRMKAPYPPALEMLAGNLPIYPKSYYEQVGPEGMSTKPVGAGPYRMVEVVPGARYVLERFDGYYKESPKGAPAIKRIVVRTLPEANTQYAELMNGSLDWAWRVPPDEAKNLATRPNIEVKSVPVVRFAYMAFNPSAVPAKTPFSDVRVRRAINHAIDKGAIVKALVGGAAQPIDSACNPLQFGCETSVQQYAFDPKKARELLAEAGYPNGFATDMVVIATPRAQAEVVASMLEKVGIKIRINEQQYAPAVTMWREGKAPLVLFNWGSYGIADVALSTSQFFGGGADDLAKDAVVIEAIKKADVSIDRKERARLYSLALKRVASEAYWVPLWTFSTTTAQNKNLNFSFDFDEFARFYRASWR
ncbi:MAG: ABC transporter substrate-binding protein [Betaproteobacteria bacterium]|nr:ABC transporter substrate-binding protein [Betaproteobacteria bacterium]MBK9608622.1 ABC transporter substrate-binding protein [Betaproteobacteria bacterium]